MSEPVRINPTISQDLFHYLQQDKRKYGKVLDQIFTDYMRQKKEIEKKDLTIDSLRKEKSLLLVQKNKVNQILDLLNSMIHSLNVQDFMAHDTNPTEMMTAAEIKQKQRLDALMNYKRGYK